MAELLWVPCAMAANRQLGWRELEERCVEVATLADGERVAVTLEFDASGDITRSAVAARPRDSAGGFVATAWGGDFGDYATLGRVRMPTRVEVYWKLPEGRFVYWRGRVIAAQELDEPFAGIGSRSAEKPHLPVRN
jgi:hypothetical protein